MGYTPGPIYSEILQALLRARLDGKLHNRQEEMEFVQQKFDKKRGERPGLPAIPARKKVDRSKHSQYTAERQLEKNEPSASLNPSSGRKGDHSEPMSKQRVLSGMRPSGKLHLGNLVGALENWKKLQDEYDCFFFAADWHALTTEYGTPEIDPGEHPGNDDRLAERGAIPGKKRSFSTIADQGARGAPPAALHDHAAPLAGARSDSIKSNSRN